MWDCVSIKPALHSSGIILSPSCWAYGPLNLQGHTNTHTDPKLHFTCINKQRQIAVVKDGQWVEHSGPVIFDVRLACFSFLIQPEHRCGATPADRRAAISPVSFELPQKQKGLVFIYLCRRRTRRRDGGWRGGHIKCKCGQVVVYLVWMHLNEDKTPGWSEAISEVFLNVKTCLKCTCVLGTRA